MNKGWLAAIAYVRADLGVARNIAATGHENGNPKDCELARLVHQDTLRVAEIAEDVKAFFEGTFLPFEDLSPD